MVHIYYKVMAKKNVDLILHLCKYSYFQWNEFKFSLINFENTYLHFIKLMSCTTWNINEFINVKNFPHLVTKQGLHQLSRRQLTFFMSWMIVVISIEKLNYVISRVIKSLLLYIGKMEINEFNAYHRIEFVEWRQWILFSCKYWIFSNQNVEMVNLFSVDIYLSRISVSLVVFSSFITMWR